MILFDHDSTPEARYWIARHRLRTEFGLTASQADEEPADEVAIHMAIWNKVREREEWDNKRAESKNRFNGS